MCSRPRSGVPRSRGAVRRPRGPAALCVALACLAGCAARAVPPAGGPRFGFPADTFAFANETVWEYAVEPASGRVRWWKREVTPPWSLRCGTMARAVRQFHEHARFDAAAPVAAPAEYARLVTAVLDTDPRRPGDRSIVIPGYADLRSFSAAHEAVVKTAMAGPWQTYLQRGNWRMIFPFTAGHQARQATRLRDEVRNGRLPIVHVLRYPSLVINHLVLLYAVEETPAELRFLAYDPNVAGEPVSLTWDRAARLFSFATTAYFPGGPVRAYEVYDGLLY
jgi:hypothetical protein